MASSSTSPGETMPSKLRKDQPTLTDIELRWRIIAEDRLQRQIARDEALQRADPALRRRNEAARVARNRDQKAVNARLRAAGLQPIAPEPSLKQRLKELQQLEARNRAEIAMRQPRTTVFSKKSGGHAVRNVVRGRARHGRSK